MNPKRASENLEWVESEGRGTVYAFKLTRQPASRSLVGRLSWAVVEVKLEEGLHLIGNLVACDPEEIEIGIAVEMVFEEATGEIALPKIKRV